MKKDKLVMHISPEVGSFFSAINRQNNGNPNAKEDEISYSWEKMQFWFGT